MNWVTICIMCVLRLRVDVMYLNYRANSEYALSMIKILYWCNWNCIEYYKEAIYVLWYDGFLRVWYVNTCFGILFRFGLVGCSIVSDLSLSDSGSFGYYPPPLWFEIYCCLGFLFTSTYSNSALESEHELSLLLLLIVNFFDFRFEVLRVE